MAIVIAQIIVILLNAGVITPNPMYEDAPIVQVMAQVAIDATREAHPDQCVVEQDPTWSFTADDSGGVSIVGFTGTCEYAGWFYRNPEDKQWSFEVAES